MLGLSCSDRGSLASLSSTEREQSILEVGCPRLPHRGRSRELLIPPCQVGHQRHKRLVARPVGVLSLDSLRRLIGCRVLLVDRLGLLGGLPVSCRLILDGQEDPPLTPNLLAVKRPTVKTATHRFIRR